MVIAGSWRVLMVWLSRHSGLNITRRGHVVWGTNIEYELGNIAKDWSMNPDSIDVKWNKAKLTKYELMMNPQNVDFMQKGDRPIHMKIWDTMNHWIASVEQLGDALSEKLKTDFSKLPKDFYGLKYAAKDAIISRSYAAVQHTYYHKKGIGLFFTPGATALNTYVKGEDSEGTPFCKHKLYNSHEEHELKWLIEALRGGRTEVFSLKTYDHQHGSPLVGYYDINSAYPYAMKLGTFPNIQWHRWLKGHKAIEKIFADGAEGVVDCDVYADNLKGFPAHIPYLGTVEKVNNRLVFPLGKWRGKYTFYEIRAALALGYKFKFHECCYYARCNEAPFVEYVDFCYAIRDEGTATGDKMLRDIGKSLGNNLFGKFGQRLRTSSLMKISDVKVEDLENAITIDDSVVVEVDEGFARHTNVVWSAYITAMCRHLLYEHMMAAAANGNEILYCDTDSIFIAGGSPPPSHQTRLGALKHEGDLTYFRALLPKTYVYEMGGKREHKAKGVPKGEREKFLVQGIAEYRKPMKFREGMKRKIFDVGDECEEKPQPGIDAVNAWIRVHKEMKGRYTKRHTLEDKSTEPLCLDELEKPSGKG